MSSAASRAAPREHRFARCGRPLPHPVLSTQRHGGRSADMGVGTCDRPQSRRSGASQSVEGPFPENTSTHRATSSHAVDPVRMALVGVNHDLRQAAAHRVNAGRAAWFRWSRRSLWSVPVSVLMIGPMRAISVVRAGVVTGGLLALVGCHPVLVNVPERGHGVIGTGVNHLPELSDDGNVVAFETSDYLTAEDHQGTWDIYARDLRRRDTELMSVSPDGGQDGCGSNNPSISGDGRYVAWAACSGFPTVPPPPGTVGTNVYVKDRMTGVLEQIGIPEHLQLPGAGFGLLDQDGSHIVIWCFPTPDEVPVSVCLQDRRTRETTVVARRTDGQIVRAFVVPTSISDD